MYFFKHIGELCVARTGSGLSLGPGAGEFEMFGGFSGGFNGGFWVAHDLQKFYGITCFGFTGVELVVKDDVAVLETFLEVIIVEKALKY